MRFLKTVSEILLFLAGLAIFASVVRVVDMQTLKELLPQLSWQIWPVFTFYPLMVCWDVQAWKLCLPPTLRPKAPYWRLFRIRIAGEGINNITPIVDIGGELLKVMFLRRRLGIEKVDGVASCIIDRTSLFIAEIVFVAMGLALSWFLLPMPSHWKWIFIATVGVFILLGALALYIQKKGLFSSLFAGLHKLRIGTHLFSRFQIPFDHVDKAITHYYHTEKPAFQRSIGLHLIGWLMGGIEMMWMLNMVGIPADFKTGIMLEALLQLVRTSSFFIPANIGTQEAGLSFFVYLYGFNPALGFAVSILKRVRMIIWTTLGFVIWGCYQTTWKKAGIHE